MDAAQPEAEATATGVRRVNIPEALAGMTFDDEIDDDQLVSGAVVLVHLIDQGDGTESVFIAMSDGLGTFTAGGLVRTAEQIINSMGEEDE